MGIKLKKSEVPAALLKVFPEYTGRKFKAEAATNVFVGDTYWSGGSRSSYAGVDLNTMGFAHQNGRMNDPGCFGGLGGVVNSIPLTPGRAIVRHCIFCGKDLGLTFYFHPSDYATLFPMLIEG